MGITVYSLLWVMQDFVHQPYDFFQFTCSGNESRQKHRRSTGSRMQRPLTLTQKLRTIIIEEALTVE